jgi:hypothetical protein
MGTKELGLRVFSELGKDFSFLCAMNSDKRPVLILPIFLSAGSKAYIKGNKYNTNLRLLSLERR